MTCVAVNLLVNLEINNATFHLLIHNSMNLFSVPLSLCRDYSNFKFDSKFLLLMCNVHKE